MGQPLSWWYGLSCARRQARELNWREMDDGDTGNPLQDDFIQSWDMVEQVFDYMLGLQPWRERVLHFLADLRRAGYDRKLRAGTSLDFFIVSRSRRHGLRPDQPCVMFWFHGEMMDMTTKKGDDEWIRDIDVALSPRVELALTELLNHPID